MGAFVNFYRKPFNGAEMNLTGWALFLLAVMLIAAFWRMLLHHILQGTAS